jgi:hypothetical protein
VNGEVYALAASGHTLYVGGEVLPDQPAHGWLRAFSSQTGERLSSWPEVNGGKAYAIVDDGSGGWFVGGRFDGLGGIACANLAHVRADLSVERAFCRRPDDSVYALVRAGSTLYVGGAFDRVDGQRRSGLAALDAAAGRVSAWTPVSINGSPFQLAVRAGPSTSWAHSASSAGSAGSTSPPSTP